MSYRHILNEPNYPWLDWIIAGKKTYEGRLAAKIEEWQLEVGKVLTFGDGVKTVKVEVTSLKRFDSFGDAYNDLGSLLVPIIDITPEEVKRIYSKFYSDEAIKDANDVVCIGFDIYKK